MERAAAPTAAPGAEAGDNLIETLQRTAGNRAVANLLTTPVQRQTPPPPAKPTPPRTKATLTEIVTEMQGMGGPYKDLDAWKAAIKPGKFLGHDLKVWNQTTQGVYPDFQTKLDNAKTLIDKEYANNKATPPKGYGITNVGGFRDEVSPHGSGVAIDIDASKNPYVMHAAGKKDKGETETPFDIEIRPVYHRIAAFILNEPIGGKDSIIPELITPGRCSPTRPARAAATASASTTTACSKRAKR